MMGVLHIYILVGILLFHLDMFHMLIFESQGHWVTLSGLDESRMEKGQNNSITYYFYHNEFLNLDCRIANPVIGETATWASVGTIITSENNYYGGASLNTTLKYLHDNRKLICCYKETFSEKSEDLIKIQLFLDITRTANRPFTFSGIDLTRLLTPNTDDYGHKYKYRHCPGETVNLTCSKLNYNSPGNLFWKTSKNIKVISSKNKTMYSNIVLRSYHSTSVECVLENNDDDEVRNDLHRRVSITLIEDKKYCSCDQQVSKQKPFRCDDKFDFYITGLKHVPPAYGYKLNCTTTYHYSEKVTLDLSCNICQPTFPYKPTIWRYSNDTEIMKMKENDVRKNTMSYLPHTFTFEEKDNGVQLICEVEEMVSSNPNKFRLIILFSYESNPSQHLMRSHSIERRRAPGKKSSKEKEDTISENAQLNIKLFLKKEKKKNIYKCEQNIPEYLTIGYNVTINVKDEKDSPFEGWCFKYKQAAKNYTFSHKNVKTRTISVTKASEGEWKCVFLGHRDYQPKHEKNQEFIKNNVTYLKTTCKFTVSVRPAATTPAPTTTAKPRTTTIATTTSTTKETTTTTIFTTTSTSTTSTTMSTIAVTTNSTTPSTATKSKEVSSSLSSSSSSTEDNSDDESSAENKKEADKKNTPIPTTHNILTAPTVFTTVNTIVDTTDNNSDPDSLLKNELIWYGAAGGLCLLILIVVLICVCRHYLKAVKDKGNQTQTYEAFSNESTNQGQFPPNLETIYARPYDTLTRMREESPYAVVQNDGPYAVPYVEKDVSQLYSKVVPKSQRKNEMYSQVLPKGQRPKPQDTLYAEIEHVASKRTMDKLQPESEYSKVLVGQGAAYDNVFGDGRYANVKDTEYAEPAYCEVSRR